MILIPSVAAGLAVAGYAYYLKQDWDLVQYIIAMLIAFDLVGGMITNATAFKQAEKEEKDDGAGQEGLGI